MSRARWLSFWRDAETLKWLAELTGGRSGVVKAVIARFAAKGHNVIAATREAETLSGASGPGRIVSARLALRFKPRADRHESGIRTALRFWSCAIITAISALVSQALSIINN
jgi:hypothetical protein